MGAHELPEDQKGLAMTREYSEFIKGDLQTPLGPMQYTLTSGTHVNLTAGGGSDKFPGIVVYGVPYYTSFHLHRLGEGTWGIKDERNDIYMTRSNFSDASSAARRKAAAVLSKVWSDHVAGLDQQLIEAELGSLNNEIRTVEEDLDKQQKLMAEMEARRQDLLKREDEANGRLEKYIRRGGYPNPSDWSPRGRIPESSD